MAGGHGGKRAGAGRKAGANWGKGSAAYAIRESAREEMVRVVGTESDPLRFVIGLVGNPELDLSVRMEAARTALPYLMPRLSAVATATTRIEAKTPQQALAALLAKLGGPAALPTVETPLLTIDGDATLAEPAPRATEPVSK